jgi:hypothetical protein
MNWSRESIIDCILFGCATVVLALAELFAWAGWIL